MQDAWRIRLHKNAGRDMRKYGRAWLVAPALAGTSRRARKQVGPVRPRSSYLGRRSVFFFARRSGKTGELFYPQPTTARPRQFCPNATGSCLNAAACSLSLLRRACPWPAASASDTGAEWPEGCKRCPGSASANTPQSKSSTAATYLSSLNRLVLDQVEKANPAGGGAWVEPMVRAYSHQPVCCVRLLPWLACCRSGRRAACFVAGAIRCTLVT